jgi:hypothetical protein
MTEDVMPAELLAASRPEQVTPGALFLVSEQAPTKLILGAGAGVFSAVRMEETTPVYLGNEDLTPEIIEAHLAQITDWSSAVERQDANQQVKVFIDTALAAIKAQQA